MNSAKQKRATAGLFPAPEQKSDEDLQRKQTQDSVRNVTFLLNPSSRSYTTLKIHCFSFE